MKKSIVAIMMAVTLVGSSLAFPVQAYAEDKDYVYDNEVLPTNDSESTVKNNHGTVTNNRGTVENNDGKVVINNGTVASNNGTVTNNYGEVTSNYQGATVTTNDWGATVTTNNGTVTNNNGTVTTNGADGIVTFNGGTIETNGGKVSENYATVATNNNGTVEINGPDGIVGQNNGTVTNNNGTVTTNGADGIVTLNIGTIETNDGKVVDNYETVTTNTGTVENNDATVETNKGTVKNNFGTVDDNSKGTVENNFGGIVYGGTVINQWYRYVLYGGIFKSGSTESKDADNHTWIGKAESANGSLGDCYITVAADNGMVFDYAEFDDESDAEYTLNSDGSYTFGNISKLIMIYFKQLTNNNNNIINDDENTGNTYESSADSNDANLIAAIEAVIAAEEKMPVTSFTSDEAVANIPETAKSAGASYNLSKIVTSQGFVAAVNKISENVKVQNAANNNAARRTSVTIYSDKPMNFTADILNAISASDIDFVFVFMHNGKMYRVTIPRGTVIDFSGHVCEGPLFIGQILGTSEEIG